MATTTASNLGSLGGFGVGKSLAPLSDTPPREATFPELLVSTPQGLDLLASPLVAPLLAVTPNVEQLLASPMFADLLLKSPQLRSDISPLTQLLTTPVPDLLPAAPATRRKPRAADAALMSANADFAVLPALPSITTPLSFQGIGSLFNDLPTQAQMDSLSPELAAELAPREAEPRPPPAAPRQRFAFPPTANDKAVAAAPAPIVPLQLEHFMQLMQHHGDTKQIAESFAGSVQSGELSAALSGMPAELRNAWQTILSASMAASGGAAGGGAKPAPSGPSAKVKHDPAINEKLIEPIGKDKRGGTAYPAEILEMPTVQFNRYIRQCNVGKERVSDIKKARRRYKNRMYAQKSRQDKELEMDQALKEKQRLQREIEELRKSQ